MGVHSELGNHRREVVIVLEGPQALGISRALFGGELPHDRLEYRPWLAGAPPLAACWFSAAERLELRVADRDGWPDRLLHRLDELRSEVEPDAPAFAGRLRDLILRVEAWSYGDSDAGASPAEDLAHDLQSLAGSAPTPASRAGIRRAMDALDDGLPADVIAAALYQVRRELGAATSQSAGLEPSSSGVSGRRSPKRGRSPNRGRSP